MFTEVKQLKKGVGFGELAITSGKPRASTIKCLTECDFATMSKNDYLRVLARIEEKSKEEIISFFQSTPLFQHWSRNMLIKLHVCIEERKVVTGQTVVEEGENSKCLFLIKEGEFVLSKKIKKEKKTELDFKHFL